ncbi:MICAL-like protein 1 isoform X2 [Lepisosteus oculatus]
MVSMKVPDRLSIITYISQYYNYFTSKSHVAAPSMKRPSGTAHSEPALKKPVAAGDEKVVEPKAAQPGADDQSKRSTMSSTCAACQKHVHLVQRYLADGRLYHRNCFRCRQCSSTLLPGSYRAGSEEGSLVCSHHFGKPPANQNGRPDLSKGGRGGGTMTATPRGGARPETPPSGRGQAQTLPVGGLPERAPALDTRKSSASQDKEKGGEVEGKEKDKEAESKPQPAVPPNPFEESEDEGEQTEKGPEGTANGSPAPAPSHGAGQSEEERAGPSRPVPAPRRQVDSSPAPAPRPVPRARTPRGTDSPQVNGAPADPGSAAPKPRERSQSPGSTSLPSEARPKDPPWMALVQSEPRKRAPPPPPPGAATPPRSGSTPALKEEEGPRPATPPQPANPFEEEEGEGAEPQEAGAGPPPAVPNHPWYSITVAASSPSPEGAGSPRRSKRPAPPTPHPSPSAHSHSEPCSAAPSPALSVESVCSDTSSKTPPGGAANPPSSPVTKSVSEPSISGPGAGAAAAANPRSEGGPSPPAPSSGPPGPPTNTSSAPATPQTNRSAAGIRAARPPPPRPPSTPSPLAKGGAPSPQLPPAQGKRTCKENPFNRKSSPSPSTPVTRTPKGPRPARPPAPGHGFPLIKRKVQSDEYIPVEDIHGEMNQIDRQLDELELRGVELEQKLRNSPNDEEEERMLVDWFKLIHEKHQLVRREAELVYTAKQQALEERQADVEYELRCLLNKPEKDWTEDDRAREQELMQDLVTIIEQRNHIVNSLDEDRQREEEEDKLLEAMIQRKEFQKEGDSEPRKKHKFKPGKVLKILGGKAEGKKGSPRGKEKSPKSPPAL